MKWNKEKEEQIIDMYNKGVSQKEIADYFNTYNTSIRRVLLRNNFEIRNNSDIQSYVKNLPKDNLDYWLGWLASDGCVHNGRVTLQVQEKDREVIENFKEYLGGRVNIKTLTHSVYKSKHFRIDFKNKNIVKELLGLGITPNKSLTFNYKGKINYKFLLGVFEGDGSFIKQTNRWFITTGSKIFCNQLFNFLRQEGFNPTITNYSNLYCVNLYRKEELRILYSKLYENVPYFLKRKRDKFGSSFREI